MLKIGDSITAIRQMPVIENGLRTGESYPLEIRGVIVSNDWQKPAWHLIKADDDSYWWISIDEFVLN